VSGVKKAPVVGSAPGREGDFRIAATAKHSSRGRSVLCQLRSTRASGLLGEMDSFGVRPGPSAVLPLAFSEMSVKTMLNALPHG